MPDSQPQVDLVRVAILSQCRGDFEWITDRELLRTSSDPRNRGLTGSEIRALTLAWVLGGGAIYAEPEVREDYRSQRDFWYYVVIEGIEEFSQGLFVEMQLTDNDPKDPIVHILNAHPPSFPTIWG